MSKKLFQQYLIDQKRHSGSPLSGSVTPPLCGTRSVSPLTPFTPVKPSKKRTRNKVSHSKKDTTNQAVAKKKIKHANPSSFVMHGNSTTSSMTFTLSQSAAKSSVTNNNCKPETKNNSNSKSTVATPETVRNRLYMLQTALKTGIFHSPLDSKQTLNINQLDSREMNSRIRLLLRISAVSYSASPTDLELLDNALNELCCTEFDMSLLCKIIAQVARVQIKVGVATLPIARCSAAEKFSFGDLLHLCKTGSILNSLSQTCPELSALHYRASHLLLFVFLDSISEKPLLRNPGKRKKALEALQKAAMKLRSIMRKITWKK